MPLRRAGGVLGPDLGRGVLDEQVEDQQQDRQVVGVADDRDRVGDQVHRHDDVGERGGQHALEADGGARVAHEAPDDAGVRSGA